MGFHFKRYLKQCCIISLVYPIGIGYCIVSEVDFEKFKMLEIFKFLQK